jgi:hypothetical protein
LPKRTSRPRRVRKGSRAALKRKCDRLWSLIIRASNGGRCKLAGSDHVRCGGPIQAAHLFGRGHHGVRHELWNGWPLCAGHHVYYTNQPERWTALIFAAWGKEDYARRLVLAKVIAKPDYAAIAADLERLSAA